MWQKRIFILQEKLIPGQLLFHIIIGMICFAINLLVWGYENKSLIHAGYEKILKQKLK